MDLVVGYKTILRFCKSMICHSRFISGEKFDKDMSEINRTELEKSESLEKFKIPYEGEIKNDSDYYLS